MARQVNRDITNKEVLKIVDTQDIEINGKLRTGADVKLESDGHISVNGDLNNDSSLIATSSGDILLTGEINGSSNAFLSSKFGYVRMGGQIDGSSSLEIVSYRDVEVFGQIKGSSSLNVVSKRGRVILHEQINKESKVNIISEGDIHLRGREINGFSQVKLVSTRGSIILDIDFIDDNSSVNLTAANNIEVKSKVDGNATLIAVCDGRFTMNNRIDGNSYLEVDAYEGIEINGNIYGDSFARLFSTSQIRINGEIGHGGKVLYWPEYSFSISGDGSGIAEPWNTNIYEHNPGHELTGTWWNNWFWSYGFVSNSVQKPNNYMELVDILKNTPSNYIVKAVGGGWSFSDITIPSYDNDRITESSIYKKGQFRSIDVLRILNDVKIAPMDLYPQQVLMSLKHSSSYNEVSLKKEVRSGIDLPPLSDREDHILIDTRGLNSNLTCGLEDRNFEDEHGRRIYRFWVEGGITMLDLNNLLNHQSPRLAIDASGGSPGATLVGTLSTATHGGEFNKKLLVDRVLAVHLIGPGGKEWWIEGDKPVINKVDLQRMYPSIQDECFISKDTFLHPSLSAEDFLKTVVVSMGSIGVIYSVVLETVEQFGIKQVTTKYNSWENMLDAVGVTAQDLKDRNNNANEQILEFLINGVKNGTGIHKDNNIYLDIAVNPLNKESWIINREHTDSFPIEDNSPDLIDSYSKSITNKLTERSEKFQYGGQIEGRIMSFLGKNPRGLLSFLNIRDILSFIDGFSSSTMLIPTALSLVLVKAKSNEKIIRELKSILAVNPDSLLHRNELYIKQADGQQFVSDILTGVLDALQQTYYENNSTLYGLSHKVGAIGWPNDGMPGRGFEVAFPPTSGFSYMQAVMDFIDKKLSENKAFFGYISTRLCPPTDTLMGMQQFKPYSVMVEIVGLRTPESNEIFDELIDFTKNFEAEAGIHPTFHWGLETERIDSSYLLNTSLGQAFKPGSNLTKIEVFKMVKNYIRHGNSPVFDNSFVNRMGLN